MVTHDVDEAVLLSDRIVMMTNGPAATIGEILRVDLPRPRDRVALAEDRHYVQCRKEVLDFLYTRQGHVEKTARLMKTFIRAVEFWVPASTAALLEFGGGLYGDGHAAWPHASRGCASACGEGLPGQAWEAGRPDRAEGSVEPRTSSRTAGGAWPTA